MLNRWKSLLREAERQLERAEAANAAAKPVWAWFAAHSCAELAVKALRLKYSLNGRERIVSRLLLDLPEGYPVPPRLLERARLLDSFYIPTQSEAEGPGGDRWHSPPPTVEAVEIAAEILEFARADLVSGRPLVRQR